MVGRLLLDVELLSHSKFGITLGEKMSLPPKGGIVILQGLRVIYIQIKI